MSELSNKLKRLLNALGDHGLNPDNPEIGLSTMAALTKEVEKREPKPLEPKPEDKKSPPWYLFLKKYQGKNENDPAFNKEMSAKWKLVGLNLGTISKNWAAWCGLFIAVGLSGAGLQYAKNGAGAMNWGRTDSLVYIDWKKNGIPQGAIIYVNHNAKCFSGSGNHVTLADGDCTSTDLAKKGANFNGYGGNQGNTAKVSSFPVAHICTVGWPKGQPLPKLPIEKSVKCSGASKTGSTQ